MDLELHLLHFSRLVLHFSAQAGNLCYSMCCQKRRICTHKLLNLKLQLKTQNGNAIIIFTLSRKEAGIMKKFYHVSVSMKNTVFAGLGISIIRP